MDTPLSRSTVTSTRMKGIALLAAVFGLVTLYSGGNVLFGADDARELAGAYVPFVVWFNFLAGFFYVLAGIGIWLGRTWAFGLSVLHRGGDRGDRTGLWHPGASGHRLRDANRWRAGRRNGLLGGDRFGAISAGARRS